MSQHLVSLDQIDEKEKQTLDACVNKLQATAHVWASLSLSEKTKLLQLISRNLSDHASEWVALVNAERQIEPGTVWAAEEWYEIFTVAHALQGYQQTLTLLDQGVQWLPKQVYTHPNGQVVAQVFPANTFDWLLFNGISTEVWMQPEVTKNNLKAHIGKVSQSTVTAAVALVLGAGNVNSISPLDVLDKLFVHREVVILKLSPVNAYLRPVYEAVLAPLIDNGFLNIVTGDAAVGSYLVYHPDVEAYEVTDENNQLLGLLYMDFFPRA